MPPTPTKSRKSKSFFEQDKYTAELTSGQLVIGVTILLVFGLVCFMLGVIVGKFQPTSPQIAAQPVQQQATAPMEQAPPPQPQTQTPMASEEREPDRLSTGPVAVSAAPGTVPQQTAARPEGQPTEEPRIVPFPEPDAGQAISSQQVEEAEPVENQLPAQTQPGMAAGAAAETAEEGPTSTLDEPIQVAEAEPVEVTPVETSPPARAVEPPAIEPQEPAAVQAPAAPAGNLTVQVAALSNRARAEEVQRRIQSNTNYEVSLVPSREGTLVMVQVGRYADRATAGRVRAEMRERYGYSDSFITTIR